MLFIFYLLKELKAKAKTVGQNAVLHFDLAGCWDGNESQGLNNITFLFKVEPKRIGFFYCSKGAENVIEWLKRTYEHLPKQPREKERALHVSSSNDEYRVRLVIYFEGSQMTCGHAISFIEYDAANWNVEAEIIVTLCTKIKNSIEERNMLSGSKESSTERKETDFQQTGSANARRCV